MSPAIMVSRPVSVSLISAACFGAIACASSPLPPPEAEGEARQLVPVPACATVLSMEGKDSSANRVSLRDEYWKLVFPAFDEEHGALPADALACTGRALLRERTFQGTSVVGGALTSEQITLGGGADGIKAVWLRSHAAGDEKAAGALALVRVQDQLVYVVAVGAHRGRGNARLSLDRLGNELVLLVREDGCKGRGPEEACASPLSVYLIRQGNLIEAARLDLEKVAFGASGEKGARDPARFHLTAAPSFEGDTLRVVEHMTVTDKNGRELRWAEVQRLFIVLDDRLEASEEPLWARVAPGL